MTLGRKGLEGMADVNTWLNAGGSGLAKREILLALYFSPPVTVSLFFLSMSLVLFCLLVCFVD